MKKLVTLIVLLAMAVPAMAAVSVTCSDDGNDDGVFSIYYDASAEGQDVSGFGLDVTADANIVAVSDMNADFQIYPGTIVIVDGNIVGGTPIGEVADHEDTQAGLGTGGVTIEMANLGNDPAASGLLCKLQVDASATVNITVNGIRGGVVLADANAAVVADSSCAVTVSTDPECWSYPCFSKGDVNGDGFLTYAEDVQPVIDNWGQPTIDPCVDFNKDGYLTYSEDVQVIIDNWGTTLVCP